MSICWTGEEQMRSGLPAHPNFLDLPGAQISNSPQVILAESLREQLVAKQWIFHLRQGPAQLTHFNFRIPDEGRLPREVDLRWLASTGAQHLRAGRLHLRCPYDIIADGSDLCCRWGAILAQPCPDPISRDF